MNVHDRWKITSNRYFWVLGSMYVASLSCTIPVKMVYKRRSCLSCHYSFQTHTSDRYHPTLVKQKLTKNHHEIRGRWFFFSFLRFSFKTKEKKKSFYNYLLEVTSSRSHQITSIKVFFVCVFKFLDLIRCTFCWMCIGSTPKWYSTCKIWK